MPNVPLPVPNMSFYAQDPTVLLGMLVFGEARGGSFAGMVAVASVARNRVLLNSPEFGKDWYSVILKPGAFSCFNADNVNRPKLRNPNAYELPRVWEDCYSAAAAVYTNKTADNTGGAIFYFAPPVTEPPHVWGPVELTATFDDQKFFRRVYPAGSNPQMMAFRKAA